MTKTNQRLETTPTFREIDNATVLDEALHSPRAVLYKHSTRCPVSSYAIEEVLDFADEHPECTVYVLKVIEQRALSDTAAKKLGVRHESPQAFVILDGQTVWHGSHNAITANALMTKVTSR
ncbi:MAG: bacillithiol system redox-active protein YtxJ [Acidobacteriota bacterium]|nr:bacillithiol system redox-active protein YtxJ [Acidobacteriota bacterium]